MAHDGFKLVRDMLKTELSALLSNEKELLALVRSQVRTQSTSASGHGVTNWRKFYLLITTTIEEQAAQLVVNQLALDAKRESFSEAKEAGADRNEIRLIREGSREVFENQHDFASKVITTNHELSVLFTLKSDSSEHPASH